MGELRMLTDIANDPSLAEVRKRFKTGIAKDRNGNFKKRLIPGRRRPSTFAIPSSIQRKVSGSALISYKQFDPQLATVVVVSVRPEKLGGAIVDIDGQHTGLLGIYSGEDPELDTLELHHDPNSSLEDVMEKEAVLFKKLNTERKNPSTLDVIRVNIFLGKESAVRFETVLKACGIQVDGLGDPEGDILNTKSGSRIIKTVDQYGEKYSSCIVAACDLIRQHWADPTTGKVNGMRDDLIHGITTFLAMIKYAGKVKGYTGNGLDEKKDYVHQWLKHHMGATSMRKYHHNSGGGNTHFKIAHTILREYNWWVEGQADKMTISHEYFHKHGVLDPDIVVETHDSYGNKLPSLPAFPADIKNR
tara:strand:- start:58 stop:1137 length:1080 start_codon:yes stop_codon:yes gene_type:complete